MTIRLLHTSDWHLGRTIRNRPRTEEFAEVLAEVVGIARDEGVDGVLVAGDLFDSRAPAPEADAILVETLVHLHEAGIPLVAIGGNHDSAQRLEAFAPLYAAVGATVVGNVRRPDAGGVVELTAKAGGTSALIACVPFVPERKFATTAGAVRRPRELVRDLRRRHGQPSRRVRRGLPARPGQRPHGPSLRRRLAARRRRARGHGRARVRRVAVPPAGRRQLPRPGPHPSPATGRRDRRAGALLRLAAPARLR